VGFVALGEAVVLFTAGLLVLTLIRTHGAAFGLPARRSGPMGHRIHRQKR
jgi:hypothetical protein